MSHSVEKVKSNWIWLSYILAPDTPSYKGEGSLVIDEKKSLHCGDTCNTVELTLSNHLGSHVDAPLHFLPNGQSVDCYEAADWVFQRVGLIDFPALAGQLVTFDDLEKHLNILDPNIDLLLIRTGFGLKRGAKTYWQDSPGWSENLGLGLRSRFKVLKAVGFDCISLSSLRHREEGHLAHKAFLSLGLRIFEDLALQNIDKNQTLCSVIALPLRYIKSDGAPCTIIARLG